MAVTLATALLSALLAVAGTAQTRVLSQIADGGPLASISVSPAAPDPTQAGLDNPRSGPPRDLTVQALARIRALPQVRSVVAVTATDVYLVPPALPPKGSTDCREPGACVRTPANGGEPDRPVRPLSTALVGVNLHQLGSLPVSLLSGRFPAVNATDQVDVTQDYLSHLGLSKTKAAEVVGTQIMICSTRFAGTESEGQSGQQGRRAGISLDEGDRRGRRPAGSSSRRRVGLAATGPSRFRLGRIGPGARRQQCADVSVRAGVGRCGSTGERRSRFVRASPRSGTPAALKKASSRLLVTIFTLSR